MNLFEKAIEAVIGSKHERDSKRMRPMVEAINAMEAEIEPLARMVAEETGNAIRTQARPEVTIAVD